MRTPSSPRPPWARTLCLAGALSIVTLTGCGGPSFNGNVYRGEGYAFKLPPQPASWRRLAVGGASLSFQDNAHDAVIAISGRCGVDSEDVPLRSLMAHLFIQFTDREVQSEEIVPFDGREALHTVLVAKLDGVPKQFDVWILKKDGCVYDLYYVAPPAHFEGGVGAFREVVHGFSTVPTDAD
jgi:hypothetical protein